ncbi:MAG: hypothetical protein UV36_C0004G0006 [Parcubacteria group bacterium GW2011_GWC2_42_6]|nr:MAG: hypothetical protein UU87_C0003G0111 [Parcubacteria group bacterium GW2011_GWA2_42_11]KKS67681.1 MAG: hypothetical protein UV36_C0004G0006 [Parcubacteria group bacterium GW2011_GWC2_42_6]KKT76438.1 MAG: hypothetical protein UW72_C0005G0006 [Parcubacteria group bacterium GW2011_GWF2_44_7]
MFFNTPGKPNNFKKVVYLLNATALGIFLSFIVHALIEICYLNWLTSREELVIFYDGFVLQPWLRIGLLALGAVGGFWLGLFWWRKVYIERAWVKKRSRR